MRVDGRDIQIQLERSYELTASNCRYWHTTMRETLGDESEKVRGECGYYELYQYHIKYSEGQGKVRSFFDVMRHERAHLHC